MQPSHTVKSRVQVRVRKIIEVDCTRAPATALSNGSVWKELLAGGTVAGAAGYPPPRYAGTSTRVGVK